MPEILTLSLIVATVAVWVAASFIFYKKAFKRIYSFFLSLIAITVLSPIYLILMLAGWIFLRGNPFFYQLRPGKGGKPFKIIKFRTMTNAVSDDGKPLPDEKRLTKYGKFLRKTSLDELPQLFCILTGKMSFIGPRPLLIKDMVFMTEREKTRHDIRGGLTGLAQVRGRNDIDWKKKLEYDVEYVQNVTLFGDVAILFRTVIEVLTFHGINEEGQATAEDYGDYLLSKGLVSQSEYDEKQREAQFIMNSVK